jgi:hypothetical protein
MHDMTDHSIADEQVDNVGKALGCVKCVRYIRGHEDETCIVGIDGINK